MRIILGSERIDAYEALKIGLVDEIVPAERLLGRAAEVIGQWNSDPRITALHLDLLRPRIEDIEDAFAREDKAAREAWASGAFTEGIESFWISKNAAASPTTSN